MRDADLRDEQDLKQFGYAPELQRSMGSFSSFAVSFSLISVTTGIFAGFSHGLGTFGPAVLWSWMVVVLGQLLVALVIADLSARIPLSGYGYQWASRLLNPHYGYLVGWLLLLQFLTGFPGVCTALGNEMCGYFGFSESMRPWAGVAVVSVIAGVHLYGIRLVSFLNDLGVSAEIAGCIAITVVLGFLAFWSPSQDVSIFLNRTDAIGNTAGLFGFAASLLMGAWCLTGFEAAADLAEETHNPRRTVPRAVLVSLLSSGIGGLLMLATILISIPDLSAVQKSDRPIQLILESKLGTRVLPVAMLVVFVSIFACGVASMAASTRLLFSLARDNMLPGSSVLRYVDPTRHSPRGATMLVWFLSSVVILSLGRIEAITSVSVVAGYLGYCGILVAVLFASRRLPFVESGLFSLGIWRKPIAILAILWLLGVVGSLLATDWTIGGYVATRATAVAIAVGVVLYVAMVSPRLRSGAAGPPRRSESKEI